MTTMPTLHASFRPAAPWRSLPIGAPVTPVRRDLTAAGVVATPDVPGGESRTHGGGSGPTVQCCGGKSFNDGVPAACGWVVAHHPHRLDRLPTAEGSSLFDIGWTLFLVLLGFVGLALYVVSVASMWTVWIPLTITAVAGVAGRALWAGIDPASCSTGAPWPGHPTGPTGPGGPTGPRK